MLQLRSSQASLLSYVVAFMKLARRHRLPTALQAAAQQLLLQASQQGSKHTSSSSAWSDVVCSNDIRCLQNLSTSRLLQQQSNCSNVASQQQQQQQQQHWQGGANTCLPGTLHPALNPWTFSNEQLLLQQQQQQHIISHQPWHMQGFHSWQQQHCYSTSSDSSSSNSSSSKSSSATSSNSSSSGRPKSSKGTLPSEGPSHKTLRALPFVISRADAVAAFTAYHSQ
jgi:hypothetical protein